MSYGEVLSYNEYVVRCKTCGDSVAPHAERFEELIAQWKPETSRAAPAGSRPAGSRPAGFQEFTKIRAKSAMEWALNQMGITDWCTRIAFMNPTHVTFNMENRRAIEGLIDVSEVPDFIIEGEYEQTTKSFPSFARCQRFSTDTDVKAITGVVARQIPDNTISLLPISPNNKIFARREEAPDSQIRISAQSTYQPRTSPPSQFPGGLPGMPAPSSFPPLSPMPSAPVISGGILPGLPSIPVIPISTSVPPPRVSPTGIVVSPSIPREPVTIAPTAAPSGGFRPDLSNLPTNLGSGLGMRSSSDPRFGSPNVSALGEAGLKLVINRNIDMSGSTQTGLAPLGGAGAALLPKEPQINIEVASPEFAVPTYPGIPTINRSEHIGTILPVGPGGRVVVLPGRTYLAN